MTVWTRGRATHRTLLPVMLYGGVSVLFTYRVLFGRETQELAPVTIEEILRMGNAKVPVETMLAKMRQEPRSKLRGIHENNSNCNGCLCNCL
jgi:hypothetical protein